MKLSQIIPFSLSVALFIIGVHQSLTVGLAESYWIIMFSGFFFLFYQWIKAKSLAHAEPEAEQRPGKSEKATKPGGEKKTSKPASPRSKPKRK
jgi:hypothetical protein